MERSNNEGAPRLDIVVAVEKDGSLERSNPPRFAGALQYRTGREGVRLALEDRLGGAPISWGVCEVPGWGPMLSADRVLAEMRSLGIRATELGAPGFLPHEASALRQILERHGMALIGGFVPVVLHDKAQREATLHAARRSAALLAAADAGLFVSAVVVDAGWSPPYPLAAGEWDHLLGMLAELEALADAHGLVHAVHPHAGTLVERRADVDVVLERSAVRWCLDTGHLVLGGYDPLDFAAAAADRVAHVHLKDVRTSVAAQIGRGGTSLHQAIMGGLFCPLGEGDAPIAETVHTLERGGYRGWYVLEQDTDLGDDVPPEGAGPVVDVRASVEYLRSVLAGQPAG